MTKKERRLFDANTDLVDAILARWISRWRFLASMRDDMRQAGFIGLMTACSKFDASISDAFRPFAWKWIEDGVRRTARNLMTPVSGKTYQREWFQADEMPPDYDMRESQKYDANLHMAPDARKLYERMGRDMVAARRKTSRSDRAKKMADIPSSEYSHWFRNKFLDTECAEMGREIGVSRERVRKGCETMEAIFQEWRKTA